MRAHGHGCALHLFLQVISFAVTQLGGDLQDGQVGRAARLLRPLLVSSVLPATLHSPVWTARRLGLWILHKNLMYRLISSNGPHLYLTFPLCNAFPCPLQLSHVFKIYHRFSSSSVTIPGVKAPLQLEPLPDSPSARKLPLTCERQQALPRAIR